MGGVWKWNKRNNKNEADYLCADGLRPDLSDGNSDVVWQYKGLWPYGISDSTDDVSGSGCDRTWCCMGIVAYPRWSVLLYTDIRNTDDFRTADHLYFAWNFFAYAYMKTQNIWVPVCLHYLNNNLIPIISGTLSADVMENQNVSWRDLPVAVVLNGLCFGFFLLADVFKKKEIEKENSWIKAHVT